MPSLEGKKRGVQATSTYNTHEEKRHKVFGKITELAEKQSANDHAENRGAQRPKEDKSRGLWSIKIGFTMQHAELRSSFIVIAFRVFVCGVT